MTEQKPQDPDSLYAEISEEQVDPSDVERFLALAEAGVLNLDVANCRAVQENMALGRRKRVELDDES